jgi:hypothetical protein
VTILRDQNIFMGGYELTGISNSVSVVAGRENPDFTVFGNATRLYAPGLKTASIEAAGFFEANPYDAGLFGELALPAGTPFSVSNGATPGAVAYSLLGMIGDYKPMGSAVGDVAEYSAGVASSGDLVRGSLMLKSSVSASGLSTVRQLGMVSATQKLYAILHVFSVSGTSPTLDAIIRSDTGSGMSSPLTRATFSQMNARGAQWKEIDGAIADDWWQVDYTLGGTDPVFGLAVILAIQ